MVDGDPPAKPQTIMFEVNTDSRGSTFRIPPIGNFLDSAEDSYEFCSGNPVKGTLRGFHLQQEPFGEFKLISCLSGSIFLAVFDPASNAAGVPALTTFELGENQGCSVFIGQGLATAWITTRANTVVHYQISGEYSPRFSSGFRFDDPKIAVDWPLKPSVVGDRDLLWPLLKE